MENTIVHLIGKPGVGKYTTGLELARRTGARLVDNHSIANPILNPYGANGTQQLPAAIWKPVGVVRAAVLETIRTLTPPGMSFIFTNFIRADDPGEYAVFEEFVELAAARGSLYVPVILTAPVDVIVERIVREDRKARMKLVDPVLGATFATEVPEFSTAHPNALVLDNSGGSAADSATAILDWVESCARRSPGA
jgi:hypothetical protein